MNNRPFCLQKKNRDLLLLPMTTPPVADGITEPENPEGMPKEEVALSSAVLQGDDRPNEQKQQKPRKGIPQGPRPAFSNDEASRST